jgi:hypothetical protein
LFPKWVEMLRSSNLTIFLLLRQYISFFMCELFLPRLTSFFLIILSLCFIVPNSLS